ncbi:hypothetical protein [Frateuria defendens]|uniref:hypothetical protein n=1 Tax=Frateuria defendens TaxID=2219559 RepID=UPI001293BB7C|nr:hypothetical protein [Frateuria defendens]
MQPFLTLGIVALLAFALAVACAALLRRRRLDRRADSLRRLLQLADQVEADLKTCRSGLQQAHAVISLNPDLPAASEQEAQQAIDAGLRSLLQQRIWVRDRSARASQQELDEAASTLRTIRDRLEPLMHALERAHHELDAAMREHIRPEPHA